MYTETETSLWLVWAPPVRADGLYLLLNCSADGTEAAVVHPWSRLHKSLSKLTCMFAGWTPGVYTNKLSPWWLVTQALLQFPFRCSSVKEFPPCSWECETLREYLRHSYSFLVMQMTSHPSSLPKSCFPEGSHLAQLISKEGSPKARPQVDWNHQSVALGGQERLKYCTNTKDSLSESLKVHSIMLSNVLTS